MSYAIKNTYILKNNKGELNTMRNLINQINEKVRAEKELFLGDECIFGSDVFFKAIWNE